MGRVSLWEGKWLRQSVSIISLLGLYWMSYSYFAYNIACASGEDVQHEWACVGSSPGDYGHSG